MRQLSRHSCTHQLSVHILNPGPTQGYVLESISALCPPFPPPRYVPWKKEVEELLDWHRTQEMVNAIVEVLIIPRHGGGRIQAARMRESGIEGHRNVVDTCCRSGWHGKQDKGVPRYNPERRVSQKSRGGGKGVARGASEGRGEDASPTFDVQRSTVNGVQDKRPVRL